MEGKNNVLRDIYATGIKKPYINLSKAKFNKIFDYKLKKEFQILEAQQLQIRKED